MIGIGIANAIGFNGNNKCSIKIPTAIKDSMVLWYDIAKQKATNKSMIENPTLKDLSGNGHDATCYNFAWSGISGIGGYTIQPFTNKDSNLFSSEYFTGDSYNLIGKPYSNEAGLYWNCGITNTPTEPYKLNLNVSGIVERNNVYIHQYKNNYYGSVALVNGKNRIQIDITKGNKPFYPYLSFHADLPYETDIHIEILPEYPNALVSDGVDDYCFVEGLPLLNKEDGYTIIVKRKYISQDLINSPLLAKYTGVDNNGAFQFERNITNGVHYANSFGVATVITFSQEDIVYQTHDTYNGKPISVGNGEDTNYINIFTRDRLIDRCQMCALYSLLLFNRDLSTDEIEWVKNNLIQ